MKQGKRAIVVGASSGIGLEVAKLLMRQGWTVGVAARRVELLQDLGAAAIECIDVTKDDATEALQRLIRKLGGMDLYFHASGIGKQNRELAANIELATVETIMKVSSIGHIRCQVTYLQSRQTMTAEVVIARMPDRVVASP